MRFLFLLMPFFALGQSYQDFPCYQDYCNQIVTDTVMNEGKIRILFQHQAGYTFVEATRDTIWYELTLPEYKYGIDRKFRPESSIKFEKLTTTRYLCFIPIHRQISVMTRRRKPSVEHYLIWDKSNDCSTD